MRVFIFLCLYIWFFFPFQRPLYSSFLLCILFVFFRFSPFIHPSQRDDAIIMSFAPFRLALYYLIISNTLSPCCLSCCPAATRRLLVYSHIIILRIAIPSITVTPSAPRQPAHSLTCTSLTLTRSLRLAILSFFLVVVFRRIHSFVLPRSSLVSCTYHS